MGKCVPNRACIVADATLGFPGGRVLLDWILEPRWRHFPVLASITVNLTAMTGTLTGILLIMASCLFLPCVSPLLVPLCTVVGVLCAAGGVRRHVALGRRCQSGKPTSGGGPLEIGDGGRLVCSGFGLCGACRSGARAIAGSINGHFHPVWLCPVML